MPEDNGDVFTMVHNTIVLVSVGGELCQMDYAIYLSHDAVSKDKRRSVFFKSIQLEKKDLKMRELHKT